MFIPSGWDVEQGSPFSGLGAKHDEVLCWQDAETPLSIWQIGEREDACFRLRLADELTVDVLPPGRIVAYPRPQLPQITIDHFLADQVFPRLLAHEGALVIHAGAVLVGDTALLLVGESGRGKSTLTASFDQSGIALLGDDAMVISSANGKPLVRPVYPSLRLLPDSLAALMPGAMTAGPVAHYSSKERIDVLGARETAAAATPVRAIFAIGEPTAAEIIIRPLLRSRGCMMLLANSFALDPSNVILARARLDMASALVRQVVAFEISYPRDYARLPEVRRAILDQIASPEEA